MRLSSRKEEKVVYGASPRADLLPPEVKLAKRAVGIRRNLVWGLAATLALTGGGYVFSTMQADASKARLAQATATTQELLAEQAKYYDVRDVMDTVNAVTAARAIGVSTEVEWKSFLSEVESSLPSGMRITAYSLATSTPVESLAQASVPLQGARVGTLIFTVVGPDLPHFEAWLDNLRSVTGYTDAFPGTVTRSEETGQYSGDITVHITPEAYSLRFAEDLPAAGAASAPATDQSTPAAPVDTAEKG